jgi:hypothetical protein
VIALIPIERSRRRPEGAEQEPNKILSQEPGLSPMFNTLSKNPRNKVIKTLTKRIKMILIKLRSWQKKNGIKRTLG